MEQLWWHEENEITSCIAAIMAYIINNSKSYIDDTIYQNNHQEGILFGINTNGKLNTIEALKRLFDICNLLGTNESYFNILKFKLSNLCHQELFQEELFSSLDIFPGDRIREIMLSALRIEFAAFVDGKRKNYTEQGGRSSKYDICSFEFLKFAYENLDAGEEYKKGLDQAYRRIKEGDVKGRTKFQGPVEKYYEIRKTEKKYIDPELEQAIIRMELGDVAQENFKNLPKDNRLKFLTSIMSEKNQSYRENLLALTNASSNSILLLEGSKKNKKEKSKLSNQTPMQVTLKEIADNYDPQDPFHVEFIRETISPVFSPVLSEKVKAEEVDLTNKESVKELVNVLIDSINTTVSPPVIKERKILISEIKRIQDKICVDIKYSLVNNKIIQDSLEENKRYLNISNKLYGDSIDKTSYSLESLTESLLFEVEKINSLNLEKTLPDVYVSRIIKHLFTHVDDSHLYTNIVSGLVKLLQDKSIKDVDKYIDTYLQTMEYYEPTYLEENYYLPEKIVKLIHICSKLNSDINFETIQQHIESGSINNIEFAYNFQDKLPAQQNIKNKLDNRRDDKKMNSNRKILISDRDSTLVDRRNEVINPDTVLEVIKEIDTNPNYSWAIASAGGSALNADFGFKNIKKKLNTDKGHYLFRRQSQELRYYEESRIYCN